jgi:hypothetical protein
VSDRKALPAEPLDHFNYPIMLNLYGRLVVLVGAGAVGQRKLSRLLQVGARVRLIDPLLAAGPHPSALVESIARCFAPADLQDAVLVFACTDSAPVNQQVADEARRRQLLCCRADQAQNLRVQLAKRTAIRNLDPDWDVFVTIEAPIVRVYGDDAAVVSFKRMYEVIPGNAAPHPIYQTYISMTLIKESGEWKIAHMHGSTA